MTKTLDLWDIQGCIVRAYGRFGFPFARHFFFHVAQAQAGRHFLQHLLSRVTTAERWTGGPDNPDTKGVARPDVTLNIGLTWNGLYALGVPTGTLSGFPTEFVDGMAQRADLLSDRRASDPEFWDRIWQRGIHEADRAVHIWVSLNAQMTADANPVAGLDEMTAMLRQMAESSNGGLRLLDGHGPDHLDFQEAGAIFVQGPGGARIPTPMEHFGFVDGIGDPVFEGQLSPDVEAQLVVGRGKLMPDQTWRPLATGEFLLGYVDESQEIPKSAEPALFARNGSFMAFRKLQENVDAFRSYVAEKAAEYGRIMGVSLVEAEETLKAKMAGRWSNGAPLMAVPTYQSMLKFQQEWSDVPALMMKGAARTKSENARLRKYRTLLIDFQYRDDLDGVRCPLGAHIRRGNVRDMLDPKLRSSNAREWQGSSVANRRRILRRGLPYGQVVGAAAPTDWERGVIFLAVCADLERQFEFVLQQWINYGMDMNSGNDACPMIGAHDASAKFVVASDPESGRPPFFLGELPQFVETRGGDYFFIPSVTTLRSIANGTVDPT